MANNFEVLAADNRRWQAIRDRDNRLDGEFVYAVKTTGVFCRPSCPSRQSKRENTIIFSTAAEAGVAGFRACLRCDPTDERAPERTTQLLRGAWQAIEASEQTPTLRELADLTDWSPSHFHRRFKKLMGLTPREYATAIRVRRLKQKLQPGRSVTDAIFDAGFGSGSRVYENARKMLGMTPAQYRDGAKNVEIKYTVSQSPLGLMLVATTAQGVCCIEFADDESRLIEGLKQRFPSARIGKPSEDLSDRVSTIIDYLETPSAGLGLDLDIQGTAFQQRVWKALQAIPVGETLSYSEVAKSIGNPAAQRAVARACAENKLAVAIPCHRVVRADRGLGGYRWGLERKRQLLAMEKADKLSTTQDGKADDSKFDES